MLLLLNIVCLRLPWIKLKNSLSKMLTSHLKKCSTFMMDSIMLMLILVLLLKINKLWLSLLRILMRKWLSEGKKNRLKRMWEKMKDSVWNSLEYLLHKFHPLSNSFTSLSSRQLSLEPFGTWCQKLMMAKLKNQT